MKTVEAHGTELPSFLGSLHMNNVRKFHVARSKFRLATWDYECTLVSYISPRIVVRVAVVRSIHDPNCQLQCISISVQALTPKLHPCLLLALMSSLVTLTTPTH